MSCRHQKKLFSQRNGGTRLAALLCACFVLFCLTAPLFSCDRQPPDDPQVSGSSGTSSETVPGTSSAESDEPSAPAGASGDVEGQTFYRTFRVKAGDLPAGKGTTFRKTVGKDDSDPLFARRPADGESLPALTSVFFDRAGDLFAVVAEDLQTGDDSLDFSYRLFRLNPETGTWAGMETEAEPHPYDRNANNRTGLFRIEYDRNAKSGEPCSYVVLYRPVGTAEGSEEERILYYNDKAEEYPRIIRQSDAYAVLSLLRGESRDFIVLDTQGTAVYRLNGGADDVFESTPLTLFEDTLLLKTDTDDDYEYDTLTYRDLKEGSHAAVDFHDNFAYWTYSPDGSAVAAYNAEDGRTDMVVCDVAGGFRTSSFTLEGTVTDAVPLGGMVFVRMKDGTAFLADAATGTLSEPIQADGECLSVFSARSMAVLSEDGTASVYAAS